MWALGSAEVQNFAIFSKCEEINISILPPVLNVDHGYKDAHVMFIEK
jgi:hypothetical protein